MQGSRKPEIISSFPQKKTEVTGGETNLFSYPQLTQEKSWPGREPTEIRFEGVIGQMNGTSRQC